MSDQSTVQLPAVPEPPKQRRRQWLVVSIAWNGEATATIRVVN